MSKLTNALLIITIAYSIGVFFETKELLARQGSLKDLIFAQLGSVIGVTASVAPNPLNTAAKELKLWKENLEKREAELQQTGMSVDRMEKLTRRLNILFGIEVILLLMVVSNFYLDYRKPYTSMQT